MVKRLCMRAMLFKRMAQRVLHLGASLTYDCAYFFCVDACMSYSHVHRFFTSAK